MTNGIELVMHPGHGKCGSTSIQLDVYKRRAELERQGVLVPDANFRLLDEPGPGPAERTYPGQFYPIWYLEDVMCGGVPVSEFERRLDEAVAHATARGFRRFLISSENLSNLVYDHASALHRALAARFERTKVIYYMRRQDDWILSSWQQWHHKVGLTLEAWVEQCLAQQVPDFLGTADAFESIYGEGSVTLLPLHDSAFGGRGLLADFYHRAGVETPGEEPAAPVANRAVNPYLCDILARIPAAFESRYHDTEVLNRLMNHVSAEDLLFRRHAGFMGEAIRNRILDHFARDNREMNRRYFPHVPFDALFRRLPEPSKESGTAREVEALKEIVAIQMDLLLRLMKQSEAQGRPQPEALRVA